MDYEKIYKRLIERSTTENRKKSSDVYYEQHHIVPKCLGGTEDKKNLVLLTAREHFIAHKLLCEIYPNEGKLISAYWMMCNMKSNTQERNYNVSNREYERLRIKFSKIQQLNLIGKSKSTETKQKIRLAKLGTTHSEESKQKMRKPKSEAVKHKMRKPKSDVAKQKMSLAKLGKPSTRLGKTHSEESKQKIRLAKLGKLSSEETKEKIRLAKLGTTHSEETKEKIRQSLVNRKK